MQNDVVGIKTKIVLSFAGISKTLERLSDNLSVGHAFIFNGNHRVSFFTHDNVLYQCVKLEAAQLVKASQGHWHSAFQKTIETYESTLQNYVSRLSKCTEIEK